MMPSLDWRPLWLQQFQDYPGVPWYMTDWFWSTALLLLALYWLYNNREPPKGTS